MRPLSVVLLVSAEAWRGSGVSFGKIAAGLSRAGHRALLITAADAVTERLVAQGLLVRQLPLRRTGWSELVGLSQMLGEVGADLILSDTPRDVRLATMATLFRRVPVIFRYNLSGRSLPGDPWSRLIYGRIAAVVFQSEYARDRAARTSGWLLRRPHRVIGNGYDGAVHRPNPAAGAGFRQRHGLDAETALVLSAAALYHDKGYATALQAVARVAARRKVQYVICGEGEERIAIARHAETLHLAPKFLGQLSAQEMDGAINAADLVLHPAPGELFPNIVAEAMASARPVVGVDGGAMPELVGRDSIAGRLVPANDVAALELALDELLRDPALRARTGQEARRRILTRFPLERMELGYVQLVEACVGLSSALPAEPPVRLPAR